MRPELILKRIEAAEEHLSAACHSQSLTRIYEQISRAGQQLQGVRAILRAEGETPITLPPG